MHDYQIQMERIADVKEEIEPLLEKHWEEIAVNQDKIKLNVDWDSYFRLEESGDIGLYTARYKGDLVGYFAVISQYHIHYQDHIYAVSDVVFVHPDHRKTKLGYRLFKFAEDDLKERGVSVLVVNTKVHKPFDPLMESMEFDLIERTYSKYLGE